MITAGPVSAAFVERAFSLMNLITKLGFTPCKAEQPLQGMESQEKEAQKENIKEISLEGAYS